jgi:UDP-N-acetylmuramoyl-tripeptide--D-alanyl-D-alanine ligase
VIDWDAARVAAASGARLIGGSRDVSGGPRRVTIDSRHVQAGDLFVGLPGERVDGGLYAQQALAAGAWGVLIAPPHAARLAADTGSAEDAETAGADAGRGAVLAHPEPLVALQSLARAWRRALGAKVVAITGSTGKTSTKDILAAVLAGQLRTAASPQNLNTEIGLPLAVLAAPPGTEALVLELAMRGPGQIAELAAIAEPDVGVIVNVGPVHLELLGSLEAIAAAKAELIAGMAPGRTVVTPAGEALLARHLRSDLRSVTFGEGGDFELAASPTTGEVTIVEHTRRPGASEQSPAHGSADRSIVVRPSFTQSHNLRNLLAAVAAARALGVTPSGRLDVAFSALRGERVALADGIVLINDCYNANPMSMRAALDDLAASAPARRVAVLGDMLELGAERGPDLHREVAAHARASGVELLIAVGPQAAAMGDVFTGEIRTVPDAAAAAALLPDLLQPHDTVLVKGSRGVGLEIVAERLAEVR